MLDILLRGQYLSVRARAIKAMQLQLPEMLIERLRVRAEELQEALEEVQLVYKRSR